MKMTSVVALMLLMVVIIVPITLFAVWMMFGGTTTTPQTMYVCSDGSRVMNPASCPTTGTGAGTGTPTGGGCFGGLYVDVTVGGKETITGSAVGVNAETFTASGAEVAGETSVASAITKAASAVFPVQNSGYIMIGNDQAQSATDRGTEYYYYKKPFNVGCEPAIVGFVNLYAEGTPTYTCYDDGTAESTCNITIGTSVIDTTKIKITTSANAYLGMPNAGDNMPIRYPLGICINASSSSDWDKIYPSPYASSYTDQALGVVNGKFDSPDYLVANTSIDTIIGDCYVLDTTALRDPAGEGLPRYTEFWLIFDPTASATIDITDHTSIHLINLCWSKNDDMKWRLGWLDDSEQGTDKLCGLDPITDGTKLIYHA